MRYLDTRDLNKRKSELEDLRDAVTTAEDELQEAKQAFQTSEASEPGVDTEREEWDKWSGENAKLEEAVSDAESALDSARTDFGIDEQEELAELENLESEIGEWRHGETLIPENQFEDYARELAEYIGAIPDNAQWPCTCIDWEQAAKELAIDYSIVTYQGQDYYVRA